MATNEYSGYLKYTDDSGNVGLLLPITTANNIEGLNDLLSQKAPANYGLGTGSITSSVGSITSNGWYVCNEDAPPESTWWLAHARTANSGAEVAVDLLSTDGSTEARMLKHNGEWVSREYITPLMQPGVEYRTTERYSGQTVYKMLIRQDTWSSGDNIEILFPDKKIYVLSANAIAGSIPLPSIGPTMSESDSAWVSMYTEVGHLVIQQRGGKTVGGPLSVIIKYYYAS